MIYKAKNPQRLRNVAVLPRDYPHETLSTSCDYPSLRKLLKSFCNYFQLVTLLASKFLFIGTYYIQRQNFFQDVFADS